MNVNYEKTLKEFDSQILTIQTKLSQTKDLKEVVKITKELNKAIKAKNDFIQLEASKEALKDTSLKELKELLNNKEVLKELGLNKKTVKELVEVKLLENKENILKEFEVVKGIKTNLNGQTVISGQIIKKAPIIGLLSFDFLHMTFNLNSLELKINNSHKLVGSKTNLQHTKHFLEYIIEYLEKRGFKSNVKTSKLTYGQPLNYLYNMTIDKQNKKVRFSINENSFYENPKLE